jgi:ribosomal protein S18 acetylase RimI-like enzyme
MKIKQPQTQTEIEEVRKLFREYEAFLDVDLCFQDFEEELASLPGKYSRPSGDLLIGLDGEKTVGCVAVRKIDDGVCEMKRLFVRPEARGTRLGRKLAQEIIAIARELGYSLMRLDTLDRLSEAMHLYKTLGFRRTEPYYKNPLPGVVYWELDLTSVIFHIVQLPVE